VVGCCENGGNLLTEGISALEGGLHSVKLVTCFKGTGCEEVALCFLSYK
jgi:hypothetical protein